MYIIKREVEFNIFEYMEEVEVVIADYTERIKIKVIPFQWYVVFISSL